MKLIVTLGMAAALAVAAAAPKKKKETTSAAQKDAIKGAIAVAPAAAAEADAGTAAKPERQAPAEGPDVTKMSFSPENIKAVVAYWQPKIQTCYEETLAAKDKDVQGVLKTKWVVNPDGIVTKVEVLKKGTTLKDPKLHECVVAVLSSMSFPTPPNGKSQPIEFPFNLKTVH